ncbi:DinB family protein [Mucilaginibacter sp.]|uniref:DinB family protein n=1 Tax=Mucilaginibacter sp. TaxID=1882438 RepID=UPI00262D2692|nr:DinB family protein [Mucilaginibacter sp.]MDB4926526.1 DinB family protein [Mucilaginibacter sp.]
MNDVLTELQDTKAELELAISSISDDQFNTIPFKDSWTPGQVSDHILKAVGVGVLYGNTKPTARNRDEKVAETAKLFLNMDIKMKSPDFILPSNAPQNKQEILSKIDDTFSRLIEAAKTLDLSLTCLAFEVPGFGEFTRSEFIWFYIFHAQRHIYQLKNIAKALGD